LWLASRRVGRRCLSAARNQHRPAPHCHRHLDRDRQLVAHRRAGTAGETIVTDDRWKTVTFAGYRLRYTAAGSGPAVILPKKDRSDYVPFERLADRYTMVQIEPLGFGRSERPADYPTAGLHEQILTVCDAEGIGEFAVWGYSQGGAMACAIAQATT